jgi:hypothetical protein
VSARRVAIGCQLATPRPSGRGRQRKVYDAGLVDQVRRLYESGQTQDEIAVALGHSQKVIWNLMRRHGLCAREATPRDQRGPHNNAWKGDTATYQALHLRVQTARGVPSLCAHCGTTTARRFEWANLTGRYEDTDDYVRLCCSCHHKMDGHVRNLGKYAERKAVLL